MKNNGRTIEPVNASRDPTTEARTKGADLDKLERDLSKAVALLNKQSETETEARTILKQR